MSSMNNTKQKILEAALTLFSQSGFTAVSIRDICKLVQIKESSVYYHYKNKRAIFHEIIHSFEEKALDMMNYFGEEAENSIEFKENQFQEVCKYFFEEYLMNDFCNKVMRLLLMEQMNDKETQEIYEEWMFRKPLKFQSIIFKNLKLLGFIQTEDCDYLAVTYYSPIFLYAQQYLFIGDLNEEKKNLFRAKAYCHVQKFFGRMEK